MPRSRCRARGWSEVPQAKKRPAPSRHDRRPWDDVLLEPADISAIKAMAAQHPRAFDICLNKICRLDAISFAAGGLDGQRATDFAEGMRFAGKQMRNVRDATMPSFSRGAPPPDLPNSPTPPPATAEPKT